MHIVTGEEFPISLNIDDDMLSTSTELTGTKEKTSLVRRGRESLIMIESGKGLKPFLR